MITIKKNGKNYSLSFPQEIASKEYIERFLNYLRFAGLVSKNTMKEAEAIALSEKIKKNWWKENEEKFRKKIKK